MAVKKSKNNTFLKSAAVAKHFGFTLEKKLHVTTETIKLCADHKKEKKYLDEYMPAMEEVGQLVNEYKDSEKDSGSAPVFRYFDGPASGDHDKLRKRPGEEQVSLHILGAEKSIADALIIKTIQTILKEDGAENITLLINNMGGKETQTQFQREATGFFRKNISLLNATCRQYFKDGLHTLVTQGADNCKILKEHAPEPMDYLNEEGRAKFKEIIEYLESFEMPYEINSCILGDPNYSTHTVFHIIDTDTKKVLAAGSRYNLLAKKLGARKEISAISANIWLSKNKTISEKSLTSKDEDAFFLVQVGDRAKVVALQVLELLHNEGISVHHRIVRDKLASQLQYAQKLKSKFMLIIGHKEAIDKSVIVKDAQGRFQQSVKIPDLVAHLKGLK